LVGELTGALLTYRTHFLRAVSRYDADYYSLIMREW